MIGRSSTMVGVNSSTMVENKTNDPMMEQIKRFSTEKEVRNSTYVENADVNYVNDILGDDQSRQSRSDIIARPPGP